MSKRDAIFPANRHALYEAHGYSAAVRTGDLLFVSGQVGSREDGSPEPEFRRQVELAFRNLEAVLAAADTGFDDIVDVTTFHTDLEALQDQVRSHLAPGTEPELYHLVTPEPAAIPKTPGKETKT